jgi:2-C-methyl-D-erythritol 4-phosphate cytidylyltransferase/2-C-methyl-D-erythritol 2,4-cyclodiphosphate synthase
MGGVPKQFRVLGADPVWMWSARIAEKLYRCGKIDELIVVFPPFFTEYPEHAGIDCPARFVPGGDARTESVLNGLRAASSNFVMIHDAARPFLRAELCGALIERAESAGTAIPLIASVDSLKEIDGDEVRIARREKIFRTQTPQCFDREKLLRVIEAAGASATDEASLWIESLGDLAYVEGDERNFKITTEFDWQVASSLTAQSREIRTGFGYDVHELVPGRRLILGGVEIESPLGLLGHSDADIICHSISDALLGAAGEGDIGTLFPAGDAKYKDADSLELLMTVIRRVLELDWRIVWIDVTLVAQIPRLARHIPKISARLSKAFTKLGINDKLCVKVKSGERIGSTGRGCGMVCHAVATIERFRV